MPHKQMSPITSLAGGFQSALSCLVSTATMPALIVVSDPHLLLLPSQLLEVGAVVQIVVVFIAVWIACRPILFLIVAESWRC